MNTTRERRPLIENAGAREYEPGDFLAVELPLHDVKYTPASCFRFVCSTVHGAQGAFPGVIHLVYIRTGALW